MKKSKAQLILHCKQKQEALRAATITFKGDTTKHSRNRNSGVLNIYRSSLQFCL